MAVRLASLACAIAVASPAFAATVDVHAGRLIDPETGRVSTDQRIRIVDGKVSAVTPWRASDGPATVDWSGLTVLPGLIDLHTHIADGATESADPAEPFKHSESATILKAVPAARTMLRAGFTTVRDVGVYRGLTDVALRDAINAGDIIGPRMFVAGGYITTPGGGGEIDALAPDIPVPETFRIGEVRNASEARDKARYLLDHGADFIKLIATGAVLAIGSEPGALELSPEEMRAACDEAKLRGSYCIAHAHGAEGIKAAIRAGARTIEHASYLDAEGIALAKKSGVWLDMDIYNGDWIEEVGTKQGWPAEYLRKNRETTDIQRQGFAAAVKAGAKLSFGTDAAVYPYGLGGRQFSYMVRYGMSPLQAIQSATTEAARALGKEGEVGTLRPGAWGDLIAVSSDPLTDIRALEKVGAVIKAGELVR
ncbi:amidohydrolase family protein [Sphingomonas sediminicola]|jgi:imidazolonepropionase-like amidohydrolase|uniref:Amidohydrolase family protein n=1 Tax=Sphingomonas sediminicola TaxID=386874 RepID=A0ABX6T9U8_9SPHN|nr:amidohydrolase family protein [Sphingomonas sediminicola]QNP46631.1 amidohydrolase family protein [Sphingomonas sediminicola]